MTPPKLAHPPFTDEEYAKVEVLLGHPPNPIEQAIFAVLWSEHCSYKSSKRHLKRFSTEGDRVIQGPGENAGVVDIGDGWVAVFKIESHNHPSYIEPYQGAATGVGGIIRDILAMGARPVALLNSLRFGPLSQSKNRYLFEQVVAGISGYGNCIGVPTVGGEVYFNDCYANNPLVNVFCLGVAKREEIVRSAASGVGNPVLYVGAKTGRDGIHGATMASAALDPTTSTRHNVQVGDPFTAKLLIEGCLEIIQSGHVVGMQDMGAAGLAGAASEMAARGGCGMILDLSKIPLREAGMASEEIMISESQERMLIVVRKGGEAAVSEICQKWGLNRAVIGEVVEAPFLTVMDGEKEIVRISTAALTSEAPLYDRPIAAPRFHEIIQSLNVEALMLPKSYTDVLRQLLLSPTLTSKEWIYQQFDYMVQTNTVAGPGGGAALIRLKGSDRALAMTVDGNGTYCLLHPYQGGAITVAEAMRNLVCVGARPIALTDGLNFGNPEQPETMWQMALCIEGMADAAREFAIPVVSGNVSLYNESKGLGVYPTPIVGMVGLVDQIAQRMTPGFKRPGEPIVLLGETLEEIGGSAYLKVIHHQERGFPPILNFGREKAVCQLVLEAIRQGLLSSAQDCAEGGWMVALAEACLLSSPPMGGVVAVDAGDVRLDAYLFGESQSRVLVSVPAESLDRLKQLAHEAEVPFYHLGTTDGDRLQVRLTKTGETIIDLTIEEMREKYRSGLGIAMANKRGMT